MTFSPAAPPAVKAVVKPAAAASKCPASPGGVNKGSPAATSPTEAENSSWLVNTPERRPSYYGGVPFDVAQSAMTASTRITASNRGGGFGTSSGSLRGGNIDGSAAATTSDSTAKNLAAGGGGRKRPKWEDSEPAPLSSLKKLLEGLEERCAEAGVSFGESRSVFGSGTAVSGRTSRPSWSLSSSSSSSRRRHRTGSSSGGRGSIVRIGSIGDGSSSYSDQAGLLGSGVTMANGRGGEGGGGGGGGDAGDVGLVSANKKNAAKRARGEGGDAVGAAPASLGIPTLTSAAAGLMSPPSPSVAKSVLKRRT